MFIRLSWETKSAKFVQSDERRLAGINEKKQKLSLRICFVCVENFFSLQLEGNVSLKAFQL